MDGILNIYKPAGMTSHDVVSQVRRFSGQRRVGHAGTLDPAAEGVLVVCLGKATKVVEYLANDRKSYRAEITFGVSTDTYDAEGRVTKELSPSRVTHAKIEQSSAAFRGEILQVPPVYSAIKLAGKPLYKMARAGKKVSPAPRRVTIHKLRIDDWRPPILTLFVECSKGTYIRSLANDLGERLGCGGHLSMLVRLASGRFGIESSTTLDDLKNAFACGVAGDLLFSLDEALLDRQAVIVTNDRVVGIRNGQSWQARQNPCYTVGEGEPIRVYSVEGEMVAVALLDADNGYWQPSKVF